MPDTPEINLARANALNVSNVSIATESVLFRKSLSWCYNITSGTLHSQGREDWWRQERLSPSVRDQEWGKVQIPGSESLGRVSYWWASVNMTKGRREWGQERWKRNEETHTQERGINDRVRWTWNMRILCKTLQINFKIGTMGIF